MTNLLAEWNEGHRALKAALARPADHPEWRDLALRLHGMCHAGEDPTSPTFDDALWQGLTDATARRVSPKGGHSTAWLVWHMARCEDAALSLLVGGCPQVLDEARLGRLGISLRDTGNAWDAGAIAAFSQAVDIPALRDYRRAVGRQTAGILHALDAAALKRKVDPARIQLVREQGAVDAASTWLTDYWGSRTIAGLILMPATRHLAFHLNEAMKQK